jgi:hypothetical protein
VVVDLVGELVEAAESVDLVVADVCDRGIDEAGGLGADCGDHLGLVAIAHALAIAHRAGRHEEGVGGRAAARRGGEGSGQSWGRGRDSGGIGRGQREGSSSRGSERVCHGLRGSVVDGKWVPHMGPWAGRPLSVGEMFTL